MAKQLTQSRNGGHADPKDAGFSGRSDSEEAEALAREVFLAFCASDAAQRVGERELSKKAREWAKVFLAGRDEAATE